MMYTKVSLSCGQLSFLHDENSAPLCAAPGRKKGGTLTLAYLDNSATTRVCEEAAQEILYTLTEGYGNPSSLHAKGFEAERLLRQARDRVAGRIGCAPEEVLFTSGGTEANNLAVLARHRRLHAGATGL